MQMVGYSKRMSMSTYMSVDLRGLIRNTDTDVSMHING